MRLKYITMLTLLICLLLINIGSAENHIIDKNNNYKQHLSINENKITNNHVTALSTGNLNTAQAQGNVLVLGELWYDYCIEQTIPITAMYFDENSGLPIVGANISFHISDYNTFDLYLYAYTNSNGFASVDFIPQVADDYEIEVSVVGETGYSAYEWVWVEPFVYSYKNYIFPPNTINPVKFTLMDKDLNPINSQIDFQFGSLSENILPVDGTIEYSINSLTIEQYIMLNDLYFANVNPSDYIIDITNRYIDTLPGSNIPYFMRVFNSDNIPLPNTNFTIYIEWYDYETWEIIDTTIFNVTTNNYGLSEFEITVPTGNLQGRFYIIKQSDFNNGPCYGTGCTQGYIWVENPASDGSNGLDFDLDITDWNPNYNEQITISVQLHNSSKYYSNVPVYLSVDGNSVKLITNSIGEASYTFTPTAYFGSHMVNAVTYIPEEGGLKTIGDYVFVTPADPHIDLSLNGNVVDININMMDSSDNPIPNSPAVLEFVRTPTEYWNGVSDDILSKYIKPASGTHTEQITLNKYGKYAGYVAWGGHSWYDLITYTPFEYSTDLTNSFYSGQDNLIQINIRKNGIPLTSGNAYLTGYSSDYDVADLHDIAPIDSNGDAILTISPHPNDDWVQITIGVSTESETYDLLDDWINLLPSPTNFHAVGVYDNAGTWALWNTPSASADIVGFGWPGTEPVAGDWDGDGTTEVGIYNTGGCNFFIQTDSGPEVIGLGWSGVTPVVGDWKGDGSDQVGVYDNMGTWALWNGASADIVGFGWPGTEPVVGDWDGDGLTEVGIYNRGGNNFLIQTDSGFDVIGLGWSGVSPVVGDWNGDGSDEVGVYDNMGTWALWNGVGVDIVGFGWPGTEPVVGDWDGDGSTEVGIYNTGGNNFFIQTDSGPEVIGLGWSGVTPVVGSWV